VKNTVKVLVAPIRYNYQQDLLLRIIDYFFDQFLTSLGDTDPYEYLTPKMQNIEEKLINFASKEEVDEFNLEQETEIVDVYVEGK
jgi:hypothetical protein